MLTVNTYCILLRMKSLMGYQYIGDQIPRLAVLGQPQLSLKLWNFGITVDDGTVTSQIRLEQNGIVLLDISGVASLSRGAFRRNSVSG